ncbi:MAG: bifunctional hydroxymethylpyrimidine kinase/phosphomethylpyrimidine kinase [Pusillimonas sp.]|nr:bifunctional hydroxymethylpyrimidine kinase/phosphomethylpyrimidine kinase [Pusillimonas sp.]
MLYGPFDPSGSGCLPADAITCSTLGAHALSTVTALHVQDTANIEEIQAVAAELIDDQARCLLEDMHVQAIMAGPLYTTDAVRVLAQIAADYPDVPLLLQLRTAPQAIESDDFDPEDAISATFELLLPQTDLVVADESVLTQWVADGLLPRRGTSAAETLMQFGAKWVLTTNTPLRPGQRAYVLQGPEQTLKSWPWTPPAHRISNQNGPLGCALTVELARGRTVPQATESALSLAAPFGARTFRPGMGAQIFNRSTS